MASYNELIRMYKLIQYVTINKYPNRYDILNYLEEEGFKISSRTLDYDFANIRADFRKELVYSKLDGGYYIDEEASDQYDSFFRFVEIATLAEIFNESLKDNNKILDLVSFDDSRSFAGIENLKEILIALSQHRKLLFSHYNFHKERSKKYEIIPLRLKEYENRWYILGKPDQIDEIWSFGIDRIDNLQIGDLHLEDLKQYKELLQKYNDIIGVSFETEDFKERIKIELIIEDIHVKYLRSLPLHHSQKIDPIKEKGKQKVTYFLIPNYEFKTQILKMGDYAEVIFPVELREEIRGMLENTLNNYN